MVEILQRIIDTKGAGCLWGLCGELDLADDHDDDLIGSLFQTWEHFSGCAVFPVPDPEKPGDPKAAGDAYHALGRGGRFIGEYGELRLKLARHLPEALQAV